MMHAAAQRWGPPAPEPVPSVAPWAPPALRLAAHVDDRHDAVISLYRQEYVRAAKLAYLLVGDRQLAEDITHDAFARVFERWDEIDDPSRAAAYLRAVIANLAMSTHRRTALARRHAPVLAGRYGEPPAESPEREALGRSTRPDILAALRDLSPKQRTAVVLKHWLRCTESEIAEALDCSVGAVRTHLHRAHGALAKVLEDLR